MDSKKERERQCLQTILTFDSASSKALTQFQKQVKRIIPDERPDFIVETEFEIIGIEHFEVDLLRNSQGDSELHSEKAIYEKYRDAKDAETQSEGFFRIFNMRCNATSQNNTIDPFFEKFKKIAEKHNKQEKAYRKNLEEKYPGKKILLIALIDIPRDKTKLKSEKTYDDTLKELFDCLNCLNGFDGIACCVHSYKGYNLKSIFYCDLCWVKNKMS